MISDDRINISGYQPRNQKKNNETDNSNGIVCTELKNSLVKDLSNAR